MATEQNSRPFPISSGYLLLSILLTLVVYGGFWVVARAININSYQMTGAMVEPIPRQVIRTIPAEELEKLQERSNPERLDPETLRNEQSGNERLAPEVPDIRAKLSAEVKFETEGMAADLAREAPKPIFDEDMAPPAQMADAAASLVADAINVPDQPMRDFHGGSHIPSVPGPALPAGPLFSGQGTSDEQMPGGGPTIDANPLDMNLNVRMLDDGPPGIPDNMLDPLSMPDMLDPLEADGDEPPVGNLDDLMKVTIRVYHDPINGGGYYEITIQPNEENDRLRPIPHDSVTIIDSSASMGNRILDLYKEAVGDYLSNLGNQDRFNLVTFRNTSRSAFPDWRTVDTESLKEAKDFLHNLSSRGKTDVYGGVAPYVIADRGTDHRRPLLVYLISDGRTTVSESLQSNAFIREISSNNRSDASIFTLSAGGDTDLFLMEFLAYNNQGVSLHMYHAGDIRDRGSDFMGRLNQIIVSDPSCSLLDPSRHELYPRNLPHLYRRFPLRLYGRFQKGATDVGLRISGYSYGHRREELVIFQDLNDCELAGRELANAWAGQKIYHLTNEWIHTQNPEVQKEARRIAAEFNLILPY